MRCSYLVTDVLDTGPTAQDEGVVVREDSDDIDALGFELVVFGYVGREVVGVAGGLKRGGWILDTDQYGK